jgi:hypothetical protein
VKLPARCNPFRCPLVRGQAALEGGHHVLQDNDQDVVSVEGARLRGTATAKLSAGRIRQIEERALGKLRGSVAA